MLTYFVQYDLELIWGVVLSVAFLLLNADGIDMGVLWGVVLVK